MSTAAGINLIVGLGNPGPHYENTRHNLGFLFLQTLLNHYQTTVKHEAKFKAFISTITIANQECKILMPTTFMNLSGIAVRNFANFYKIPPNSMLVVHDELDFVPGIIRLKQGGGANGHNGIQNIIEQLGDNNFWRLRIGIGKPLIKETITNYVLQPPLKTEMPPILQAIHHTITAIPDLINGNFNKATQQLAIIHG